MPSFTTVTAALALAGSALATPVELKPRNTFSISQNAHKIYFKNGAAQVAKAYRKYGKAVPDYVSKAAETYGSFANQTYIDAVNQQGSESATPSDAYDSSYLSPVSVGGTTLELDFDTGSADLWAFSSLQPSSQRSGHAYYTVNSAKAISGASWKISYGDGSGASGKVYADQVVVGPVTATRQAVEAATSVSTQFAQDQDTDGLLGLAFSSINTVTPTKQTTFFDTVKSTLSSPLFGVELKYHAAGTYDFGFIDTSKYTGSLVYANVDSSQGFWEFTASGYSIGSGSTVSTSIDGIADTGTTLLLLPDSIVSAYYRQVSGSQNSNTYGGYVFSCSATLPDFNVVVGGKKLRIPGKFINYAPANNAGTTCFGGIQSDAGVGFSIFGDIFLKAQYVVFDASVPRLGFAAQPGL